MKALAFVWLALVVAACGDSSGPNPQAASVTGIAGDSQVAPTGAPLPFPLSLVTLGSNGQPVKGISVTWSVTPAGGASFAPPVSTSDANGVAATSVTVGATVANLAITATVPGLTPVVYHALAVDPCTYVVPYTVGQTVNGALAATDCNRLNLGWYYDFYGLDLPSGQQSLRITMTSTTFDTYIDLWRATPFAYFGYDDDIVAGVQQNSQLDIILPGDLYVIGANSYDQHTTGAYAVTVTPRPAGMNGCREVWVARGVTASDSITPSDCADSSATPHSYDVARLVVYGVSVLSITARSTAINPTLALYRFNPGAPLATRRTLVASNDDSSAAPLNTNAFIAYSVPDTNFYDVIISSSAVGERGPYTLEVSASTTLSAPRPAPSFTGRDFWRGRDLLPKRSASPKL